MKKINLSAQEIMTSSPVIPVIAIDDAHQTIDLAHALMEGGIKVLEITLRTPAALDAIRLIAEKIPQALVGAGTVLNSDDLQRVIGAGAKFAISPGSTERLLTEAAKLNFPLLPGVATASEIMLGLDLGYTHFKLFPAVSAGGITALKSFAGPFQQAKFCPTGGINENNFLDFLKLDNVLCIGGTWIAPNALVKAGKFSEITKLTASALSLYKQANL
jgi:2-dehydro-3-deoxyphosphogluconate aldolase / (4S)-4-hydroxy-2-oxoglutarate aldolase